MNSTVFPYGQWICAQPFAGLKPVDVYGMQQKQEAIELPEEQKDLHMIMRKRFSLGAFQKVNIRITADDYYKLYLNGRLIGQGPAQGYHFCYYWNEFDLTGQVQPGENTLLVDVYYQGLINRAYNSGDRRMGMVAELYADGACVLSTDASWECAVGPRFEGRHLIGNDTMFSEDVDSRKTAGDWRPCCEKETDYTFSPAPAKALQLTLKKPRLLQTLRSGGYLYDFGEEITASLRMTAAGKAGDRIRILCGEELDGSEEKVRYNMRCGCLYEEYWTLDDGENSYEQYDYKGFRYVAVIPQGDAELRSLEAVVRHYPFDDGYCTLKTDSTVLQKVWDICKNGVKYGSQEVYVDCPTREKGQYAGDLTVTSAAHLILTGDGSLLKKAIDNQMQSQRICDGLLAVTPGSFHQEIADYSLQFPILALRYYRYSGDRAYLGENLKICEDIIRHFRQYERADGLLENVTGKWNLVDWPDNLRDGYDFALSDPVGEGFHNVINAFYIGCVMQTEQIKELLGVSEPKESPALAAAFRKEFFNEETGLYTDSKSSRHSSLHANVIPAFYGFCPEESEEKIGDFIMQKGLCCGVYMAYFVLKALCRMGRVADAYQLIVSQGEHSWYNMVREGATTCFEAWGREQKWNTSLCHPWASAPVSVLAEDILPRLPELGKIEYRRR